MMDKFRTERDAKNAYISMRDDAVKISEENQDVPRRQPEEEKKEESSQRTRQNDMYLTKADSEMEIIHQAAILAPIIDRVGRLLSDLSPQLNNIVRQHQVKVQEEIRQAPVVSVTTTSPQNED